MSVTFYAHNGNDYYKLNNWTVWQNVDKPQQSKIPEPVPNDSRTIPESFPPNINKENIRETEKKKEEENARAGKIPPPSKKFTPPAFEEIQAYCIERKNNIDPQKFFDYFTESGWVDSKGDSVRNWKQKIITWEGGSRSKANGASNPPAREETQKSFSELVAERNNKKERKEGGENI
jgi:hypothetical protein